MELELCLGRLSLPDTTWAQGRNQNFQPKEEALTKREGGEDRGISTWEQSWGKAVLETGASWALFLSLTTCSYNLHLQFRSLL